MGVRSRAVRCRCRSSMCGILKQELISDLPPFACVCGETSTARCFPTRPLHLISAPFCFCFLPNKLLSTVETTPKNYIKMQHAHILMRGSRPLRWWPLYLADQRHQPGSAPGSALDGLTKGFSGEMLWSKKGWRNCMAQHAPKKTSQNPTNR